MQPALPVFLRSRTWVDFRKSDLVPLDQLVRGITGARTRIDSIHPFPEHLRVERNVCSVYKGISIM